MIARLRKFLSDLGDMFWVLPGLMVMGGALAAVGSVHRRPHRGGAAVADRQPLAL